jgi:Putative beta-barrel porin-2, OmpL-like. bbp2
MAFSYFHCNCTIWCRGKQVFAPKVRRHKTKRKQSNKQHRRNQMKFNKWTVGLAAIGVVSLASAARADEAKMSQVQTALSNTTLSGYVDVSAQWNPGQQNGYYGVVGNTPGYAYGGINKADGFNLNAVDLALDKPMDESSWAAGYHVELMAGPDNPTALNVGTVAGVNSGPIVKQVSSPLVGIRQAYVTVRTPIGNGIDWKLGVFDTIIGYESTSSPLDPNYTRSYGYSIEPTTHTGLLASYKFGDCLTITGGVADSSNVGTIVQPINGRAAYETQKAVMGAIALTAPDSWGALKGATLNLGVVNSADSDFVGGLGLGITGLNTFGTTSWYAGLMIPTPNSKLKFGTSFDYLELHNSSAANKSDDSTWTVAVYGNLQATDKLSFNARAEYLDDSAGLIYGGYGPQAEEFTFTTQYQLWANVLSRVELRWDHVEHGTPFDASTTTGSPVHANAFMVALNLIYQF